jgi:hypothetical protein
MQDGFIQGKKIFVLYNAEFDKCHRVLLLLEYYRQTHEKTVISI